MDRLLACCERGDGLGNEKIIISHCSDNAITCPLSLEDAYEEHQVSNQNHQSLQHCFFNDFGHGCRL